MDYKNTTAFGICLLLFFIACERPDAPDFSLEHRVQVPLTAEREYRFLGEGSALIDTTNEDYSSLFTVGGDGLVSLSKQEDLAFADLDGAVPEVDVDPTNISSEVGELELGSFASGSGAVAEVSFEDVTGISSAGVSNDDPVPDQNNRQVSDIVFSTDYFVSATIKSGSLQIAVENQLGFDIDVFDIEVFSQGSTLGIVNFADGPAIDYGQEKTGELPVDGERLENLTFTLTVSWTNKTMETDNPGPFFVNQVEGNNLIASEVEAAIPSQDFTSSGTSAVDDTNFEFAAPDHHIELESGQLLIHNIINNIDLDINQLQISFPDIRRSPYGVSDSLVITFEGDSKIGAKCGCGSTSDKNVSLTDVRIYAENNVLDYNISGTTEDTQADGSIRTISEGDNFTADVELENLEIKKAFGIITPRHILINDDVATNGTGSLDLFNNDEAEVIHLDALDKLSAQTDGLEFVDPLLSILYNSNLDVQTTVYAAIAGENTDGDIVYLSGKSSGYSVSSSFSELKANGQTLSPDQLIKFELDRPESGQTTVPGAENFDKENTNADDFLNILPTEVRFIAFASLNEEPAEEGTVRDPVRFEPSFGVDVPLHFSSELITFSDTSGADLKDLPGEGDSQTLSEATVTIGYTNNLPFELDLSLVMLGEQLQTITEIPLDGQDAININGASVDQDSRFVVNGEEGKMSIALEEEQLALLNKVRHMVIRISFNTTNNGEVKIRAEDSVSLSIKMSVAVKSNVN